MTSSLRADARRNQEQVLAAARDVFVERGSGAPLDEIARRAGVGIATLYRRFTDRQTLMRAVVLDALTRTAEAAEQALAEEPDAFTALATYAHSVLDLRVSAVIPVLLDRLDELEQADDEIAPARERGSRALQAIVTSAHEAGTLRADVTSGDVGLLLVRLARPLPGPLPPELDASLAHRHLDLVLAGMRSSDGGDGQLDGPALSLPDLAAMTGGEPTSGDPS